MGKKKLKQINKELELKNSILERLISNKILSSDEQLVEMQKEEGLEFLSENVVNSNTNAVINEFLNKDKDKERLTTYEYSKELKCISKQVKTLDKGLKKSELAHSKIYEEINKLYVKVNLLEKHYTKMRKKQKALYKDVDEIKELFVLMAYLNGGCSPGVTFKELIKEARRRAKKGIGITRFDNKRIKGEIYNDL